MPGGTWFPAPIFPRSSKSVCSNSSTLSSCILIVLWASSRAKRHGGQHRLFGCMNGPVLLVASSAASLWYSIRCLSSFRESLVPPALSSLSIASNAFCSWPLMALYSDSDCSRWSMRCERLLSEVDTSRVAWSSAVKLV